MKDLCKASYTLDIKLFRDHCNEMIGLSQAIYIGKISTRFSMIDCRGTKKKWDLSDMGSKGQSPNTLMDIDHMLKIPYALAIRSASYVMLCTRLDTCQAV